MKTQNLLYMLVSTFVTTFAQAQNLQRAWISSYPSEQNPLNGSATDIAVVGYGNSHVTGYIFSSATREDFLTIKYDPTGAALWVAHYDSPGNSSDIARAIALDSLGNVYVTGASRGAGTGQDFATIKYNSAGIAQWVARYNSPADSTDTPVAIALDAVANVYVTGASLGAGTSFDYATIKYDSAGAEQWVARYNGEGNSEDLATDMAVEPSGHVYVTGRSKGLNTDFDYTTIKYNSSGSSMWIKRYNGPGNGYDGATAIACDSARKSIYVTGASWGANTDGDYATIKYLDDGAQVWVARYDGHRQVYDGAKALALDRTGNLYVTGSNFSAIQNNLYYYFVTTIKYNAAGAKQWEAYFQRSYDPLSSDDAQALNVDAGGNVYLLGSSYFFRIGSSAYMISYDSLGARRWLLFDALTSAASMSVDHALNIYVAGWNLYRENQFERYTLFTTIKYLQTPVAVAESEVWQPNIFALAQNYPNPFNPTTTIRYSIPRPGLVDLKVFNLSGQEVATLVNEHQHAGAHEVQWHSNNLPGGLYVYRLQSGDWVESKKIILLK